MLKQEITQAIVQTKTSIALPILQAFIATESSGKGFDSKTGKILLQFEAHLFSRATGIVQSEANNYHWDENKVDVQSKEWIAFNEAFSIDPTKAMESTSIGLPQILGLHWKRLGYASVGAMWDAFKVSEVNQIVGLIKFIETDKVLYQAILDLDFDQIAKSYNGRGYKALAIKLGRVPYDITMAEFYKKYSSSPK